MYLINQEDEPSKYEFYRIYTKNERYIFNNLNKCVVSENFVDAEIFVPESKEKTVRDAVNNLLAQKGDNETLAFSMVDVETSRNLKLPTYIKTNEFTWTFQEIVNTYGVPRYKEFNPAVFNIITFPFLFGMMFGDVAHGSFLLIFGLYVLLNSKSISENENSRLKLFLKLKYILPMMGFFSLFCGLLYNDFASTALPLSSSCYENKFYRDLSGNTLGVGVKKDNCDYYFGIDHKWYSSSNDLSFLNSLKMKLAVIFGVAHMSLGIILKGSNCLYFKDYVSFFSEFIPQIVFMLIIFGYMDLMIFMKWLTDWNGRTNLAPNITSTLLNLFLKLGKVEGEKYDPEDVSHFDLIKFYSFYN